MTLANKTKIGIFWNFIEQMTFRGIGIVITLLLARLLVPEDFGLIAMMSVFITVSSSLMDSGFKQALIRKCNASQDDYNTAFYTNLALGSFSYLLLFFCAPLIADFYEETRLTALIRVAGGTILINAFQIVPSAILNRDLNFKAQLKTTIPASIISGISAVVMAYSGMGVWALIAQALISALIITVYLWYLQVWRPRITFSYLSFKEMFGFGFKLFLSSLLDTIFTNIFVVVIAKIFSATIAGHYFFAESIKKLVLTQIVSTISTVIYPALATKQHDDLGLKNAYRKVIQVTTFLLFPVMGLLGALAEPFFKILLSEEWLPAVPYLQLMCISGLLFPLHVINLEILKIKGRSDIFLYLEIIKKISITFILLISYRYGVMGILVGQIISSIVAYFPNSYFSNKLIGYTVREQLADFMPNLLLASFAVGLIYIIGMHFVLPDLTRLIIYVISTFIVYLLISHFLKIKALKYLYNAWTT